VKFNNLILSAEKNNYKDE
jgi:hypothetical protein